MVELRVPVSAPGATEAAGDTKKFAGEMRGAAEAMAKMRAEEARLDDQARKHEQAMTRATKVMQVYKESLRQTAMEARRVSPANDAARFNQAVAGGGSRFDLAGANGGNAPGVRRGIGGVISRLGGGLARFGSAMGLPAGFGPLGVAAAAAAIAFRNMAAQSNENVERAKRLAQAQLDLTKALTAQVDETKQARASQFRSEAGALRRIATSGRAGEGREMLAHLTKGGFSNATGGVASLLDIRDPKARAAAQRAAELVSRLEGVDFSEATTSVMKHRRLAGTGAHSLAARTLNDRRNLTGRDRLTAIDIQRKDAAFGFGIDADGEAVRRSDAELEAELREGGAGAANGAARRKLVEARAPEAAVMGEWFKTKQQEIAVLQAGARAQDSLVAGFQTLFTVTGSLTNQLSRMNGELSRTVGATR